MLKKFKTNIIKVLWEKSLEGAAREQGLSDLAGNLCDIVPDISRQYSAFKLDDPYLLKKVRYLHAFQISLVKKIIEGLPDPTIVDIGDSSGTHLQYLNGIYFKKKNIKCLSVNLDEEAVKKIEAKGLKALRARAEELSDLDIDADVFLCFEMLEHLSDPYRFLYNLSTKTKAKYLVVTVPYVRMSRVGLYHIRENRSSAVGAENTHLYEFDPDDLRLLVRHSGWDIVDDKIYLQYPKRNILYFTKTLWRKFDFEGFYGLILKRDDSWSSLYKDW